MGIRQDRENGMTYPAISAKHGVPRELCRRICARLTWKWLDA